MGWPSQTFLTFLQGTQAPHTPLLGLAARGRASCPVEAKQTPQMVAEELGSSGALLLYHQQAQHTAQSTGWETLQRKPNLELSSPCSSFCCRYQNLSPCLSSVGQLSSEPGNAGVWRGPHEHLHMHWGRETNDPIHVKFYASVMCCMCDYCRNQPG